MVLYLQNGRNGKLSVEINNAHYDSSNRMTGGMHM